MYHKVSKSIKKGENVPKNPKINKIFLKIEKSYDSIKLLIKAHDSASLFVFVGEPPADSEGTFDFRGKSRQARQGCVKEKGTRIERRGKTDTMFIMTKVNILDAAKFMIKLYYKTGEKYRCTLTKIEKLLAIADLIAMRDGNELFSYPIVSHDCGVGFPVLSNFFYSNIISGGEEKKEYITDDLDEATLIPKLYQIDEDTIFSPYLKNVLIDTFRKFGDWTARDLGLAINEIKPNLLSEDGQTLSCSKTKEFFGEPNQSLLSQSMLYCFVYTYESSEC